jgi:hypothetical protein
MEHEKPLTGRADSKAPKDVERDIRGKVMHGESNVFPELVHVIGK